MLSSQCMKSDTRPPIYQTKVSTTPSYCSGACARQAERPQWSMGELDTRSDGRLRAGRASFRLQVVIAGHGVAWSWRGQNTQVSGVYPGPIDTKMGEVLTVEKASPADAARAIVAGIIAGDEETFPDRMSQGTGPAFFADPKGLERQVAGVPTAA